MTRWAGGLLFIILLLLFPGNKTGRERRAELKKVVHTINNNKILNFVSLAACPDNPCIAKNNTFLVHHPVIACTHKIRPKFNFRLKRGKCSFQCHTTLSRASHALSIPLLSLQSLFTCFRGSHTSHTCSILLLSLQSLFTCFRGSHTSHTCSILLLSL